MSLLGMRLKRAALGCGGLICCVCSIATIWPGPAEAGSLPTPYWSVPTHITTEDGYADLSWAVSGNSSVKFYRLTETFGRESVVHFVDHPTTRLYRLRPGNYRFRVQACTRDASGYPSCGNKSPGLDLTVLSGADNSPIGSSGSVRPPSGQSRSPSGLTPGRWHNPERMGHGWSFYWKSRLSLPETSPLYGDAWDLVGLWYTYEERGGIYRPVFAELVFTEINAQQASGTIVITRDGQPSNVGAASITFQSETQATITWEASFIGAHLEGEDQIELLVAPDSNPVNNHSHYSGLWNAPAPYDYVVSQGLGWISEAFEVVFYDEEGQPSWIIAEGGEPVPGHTDLCFYYVSHGVAPGTTGNVVFYENGCDADAAASPGNRNGFRRFTDFEQQEFWADFSLPGGTAPTGFVAGSQGFPHDLEKSASFHRIRFDAPSGSACTLAGTAPECGVDLTWFTDGNYPDASFFVHETQSNERELILTSPVMEEYDWSTNSIGSYVFELRMGDTPESALMALSETFEVTGSGLPPANPESPPSPVPAPDMTPSIASSSTGTTAGEFSVLATGGASYRIPILTAPGSGGFSPAVSLVYDSHSANGPMGVGWSIEGFSVISRCAQTHEQDGIDGTMRISFTFEDRFCLDGERLMAINGVYGAHGTEYRKERDDLTRVISYGSGANGPEYFKTWNREGVLYEFGRSEDSRIETRAEGVQDVAFVWAQNLALDTSGNFIKYHYLESQEGPVEFALDSIHYTGNQTAGTQPYAEIRFEYDPGRDDLQTNYLAGVANSQTRLLQRIDSLSRVESGSPLEFLRSYQLTYGEDGWGRATLETLTECRDPSRVVCFEPTQFSWRKSEHQVSNTGAEISSLFTENFRGMAVGDINGDGRSDLLITERDGSTFEFYVATGEESGTFAPTAPRYSVPDANDPDVPVALTVIDLNADGYQDVIFPRETSGANEWIARLAGPGGLGEEFVVLDDCCGLRSPALLQVMDFNGDGLADILTNRPAPGFIDASEIIVLINDFEPGDAQPGFALPLVLDIDVPDLFPAQTPSGWVVADEAMLFGFPTAGQLPGDTNEFYGDGSADILVKLSRNYQRCMMGCPPPNQPNPGGPPVFRMDDVADPGRAPLPGGGPVETGKATFYLVFFADESGVYSTYDILARGSGEECDVGEICDLYTDIPSVSRVQATDINADGLADVAYLDEESDWHHKINTGAGFLDSVLIGQPPDEERAELARFIDLSGDGFPEMIYPNMLGSDHARWMIQINDLGHGFSAPQTSTMPVGNSDQNDFSVFLDFTADGISDQIFVDWDSGVQGAVAGTTRLQWGHNLLTGQTHDAANVINQITNGFGAETTIEYRPLTDSTVYTRLNSSAQANWGRGSVVYDLTVPFYVVSRVQISAPVFGNPDSTFTTEYHYVGARLQAGGRGLLGFAEMVEWDPQKQLRSHNRFRQEFPFTGSTTEFRLYLSNSLYKFDLITDISNILPFDWPSISPVYSPDDVDIHGTLIQYNIREYEIAEMHSGSGSNLVTSPTELEREFSLQGDFKSKTFTAREYDSFGNILTGEEMRFETDGASPWSRVTTDNSWSNDIAQWRLGRLTSTEVEHWRVDTEGSIHRHSTYAYHPSSSLLTTEISQPGSSSHQVITQYGLDVFGNRESTTITGAGMLSRTSSSQFDELGRFVTVSSNAYNQVTHSVALRDVFGNALNSYNIDDVLSLSAADHMGRPFVAYSENGSWSITNLVHGAHAPCSNDSAYQVSTLAGGGSESLECFDQLGRTIRSATKGFLGEWILTDTYYESSGQPERISEPYFEGQPRYWNSTQYDALGRITTTTAANGLSEESSYDSQATHCAQTGPRSMLTRADPGDGTTRFHWEYRNVAGETERVLDQDCGEITHAYDSVGNLVQTVGIQGATTTINYDEMGEFKIQLSDPDKGDWQYASNPLGEVTRQLDSKDQAIDFEYDQLGRITHRRELRDVQSLIDGSFLTVNHEARYWQNSTAQGVTGRGQVYLEEYLESESGAVLHSRSFEYDEFGRVEQINHSLEGEAFSEQMTYDEFGRPFQHFDASGDSRGIRFHYNEQGYPEKFQEARDGTQGPIYQHIDAMDPRGNPIAVTLGNQVEAFADYDPASGFVQSLEAYGFGGEEIQFVEYEFDRLGNLLSRHDRSGAGDKFETFEYDMLNRLERVLLTSPELGLNDHLTQNIDYYPNGNISYKSGVGPYSYGMGPAGPHAVTQVGSLTFSYDENGNQISSSDGRSITYSVFDKAERVSKGADYSEFSYGLGNRRYKRADSNSVDGFKSTLTIGGVERIEESGSEPFFKRYIQGVAIVDSYPEIGQSETKYLTKDHLGSIHSISNEEGLKILESHVGPWGIRQSSDWQTQLSVAGLTETNEYTTRGFTGHEHADGVGVIHMNGRIYDPYLGRFLQADPFVQEPRNGQSLNRYSYALNNPLSYTDPSGFFFKRFIKRWGRVIVAAVVSYYTFGAASNWAFSGMLSASGGLAGTANVGAIITTSGVIGGAAAGFVGGAIVSGSLRGATKGAFVGGITGGIASHFGDVYSGSRILADSLAGGVSAEIYGGSIKDGVLKAALTSLATYSNVTMRRRQIANSNKTPGQVAPGNPGYRGVSGGAAGERILEEYWESSGATDIVQAGEMTAKEAITSIYLPHVLKNRSLSPLGCFQGSTEQCIGSWHFNPTGSQFKRFANYVLEGYSGPHDTLNSWYFYNGVGMNRHLTGFGQVLGRILNPVNVLLVTPIVLPTLIPDYSRHLFYAESK